MTTHTQYGVGLALAVIAAALLKSSPVWAAVTAGASVATIGSMLIRLLFRK
jgi:hypothetical protein